MAGLLIYDGDCGFCTSTAAWMLDRFDTGSTAEPWQSLDLAELGLTEVDVTTSSWWVDSKGQTSPGALGFANALGSTKPRWTRLAGLTIGAKPILPVARLVYSQVVKYRHKLPGSTNACKVRYPAKDE